MAEIAARSSTKIGSLYRFFPNKEVLANALIAHYHEGVHNAFDELDSRIQSLSISALADFLLDLMVDLHKGAGPTMKRLLEIPEVLWVKRGEFSRSIHKHIVRTLTLRSPGLTSDKAQDMAVVWTQYQTRPHHRHMERPMRKSSIECRVSAVLPSV
jgi:AcrR family transcriptional regulator